MSWVGPMAALCTICLVAFNVGLGWADSDIGPDSFSNTRKAARCESVKPRKAVAETSRREGIEDLIFVATARVRCVFDVFCPAGHRCCNVGATIWCCPGSVACDHDVDDDWTGCHGADAVDPS